MARIHEGNEARTIDVGIDLRRRNIRVPQKRLQHAQVGPAFKQRAFNEALIAHGPVAVRLLRRYVLGE